MVAANERSNRPGEFMSHQLIHNPVTIVVALQEIESCGGDFVASEWTGAQDSPELDDPKRASSRHMAMAEKTASRGFAYSGTDSQSSAFERGLVLGQRR